MARRDTLTRERLRSLCELGQWEEAWDEHQDSLDAERGRVSDLWRGAGEYVGWAAVILSVASVLGGGIGFLYVRDRTDNAAEERACARGDQPGCTAAVQEQEGHENRGRVQYLLSRFQERTGHELPKTRY